VSHYAGRLRFYLSEWRCITNDEFVLSTIEGYKIPFITLPSQSCEPVQPEFSDIENLHIDKCITKLKQIGAIVSVKPDRIQFVSKIFAVPKSDGTYRLILNLKEVNKFIEHTHFKMEDYRTVCNLIQQDGYLGSIDLQDAYHLIHMYPGHQVYLRFRWKGILYQYTCLPFGLSSAPRVFTKIMRPVVGHLRGKGNVSVQYLDDILLLGKNPKDCAKNIKVTSEFLIWLGFLINNEKSMLEPSVEIKYLGFNFNTSTMTLSLPANKATKIIQLCKEILSKLQYKVIEAAKLIGHLVAASPAVPYSILYTRQLEYEKALVLAQNENDYNCYMTFSAEAIRDIEWWITKLPSAKNKIRRDNFDFCFETDASLSGWGVRFGKERANGFWNSEQKLYHINRLELLAAEFGLHCFFRNKRNVQILLRTDNTTALAYVNRFGGCKSPELHEIAKRIWSWCEASDIWLVASYISSAENYVADFESRKEMDIYNEWSLNLKYYDMITHEFGFPNIDLFASHLNNKCDEFISWHPDPGSASVDAFTVSWANSFFYAFPPFCLIPRVLRKIRQDRGRGIVVVPKWSTQPWYPMFLEMKISKILILGPYSDLLICPLTNRMHPMNKSMYLMAAILSSNLSKDMD